MSCCATKSAMPNQPAPGTAATHAAPKQANVKPKAIVRGAPQRTPSGKAQAAPSTAPKAPVAKTMPCTPVGSAMSRATKIM